MDPISIAPLVASTWAILEPYVPILATKAADEIGKKVPAAVGKVWDAIKQKFETKDSAKEAMDDLLNSHDDGDAQAAFRQQLKKIMAEDDSFATDLSTLLEAVGDSYNATVTGGGAIAQGAGAQAVGAGGVMIGGNASGNIVTGNNNTVNDDKNKKK